MCPVVNMKIPNNMGMGKYCNSGTYARSMRVNLGDYSHSHCDHHYVFYPETVLQFCLCYTLIFTMSDPSMLTQCT